MIVVYFLAAQIVMALFFYPLLVVGKRADEEMGLRKRSAREAHRYILKEWNLRKTVTT